jgi:hypothetical protein
MDFLKEFPASDMHPQIRRAGFWGATVFRALCRMSARHDLDGEIPPQYQDMDDLADVLRCPDNADDLRRGLDASVRVGLLRREPIGEGHGEVWVIDGWLAIYTEKHKTNAERREAWREKKRAQRSKPAESKECPPVSPGRPLVPNVPLTRHDETRHDETDLTTLSSGDDAPVKNGQPASTPSLAAALLDPPELQPDSVREEVSPKQLQALWNAEAHPSLPRWKELTDKRRQKAGARLRERPLEEWREVIRRINASSFLRGEKGGWRARPDWLLQPDTATKVLEGQYDDRALATANIAPAVDFDVDEWGQPKAGAA